MPSLYWMFEISKLKPAVRVLAEHASRSGDEGAKLPVICLQYVGAGKVLFHAIDATWRWRYRVGDVFFARYWVQTIRYLSRAKLLGKDRSADIDDRSARVPPRRTGQAARALHGRAAGAGRRRWRERRARAAGRQEPASAIAAALGRDGASSKVRSSIWPRDAITPGSPRRRWKGARRPRIFSWRRRAENSHRVEADFALLQTVSAETKGQHFTLSTAGQLKRSLPGGRQVPIETLPPIELWNRWPLVLAFVALLVVEWLLRKRHAMV